MDTPINFDSVTTFMMLSPSFTGVRGLMNCLFDIIIISDFAGWIVRLLLLHHSDISLIPVCNSDITSSIVFPIQYYSVSSANISSVPLLGTFGSSFTCIANSLGPSKEPWGTPYFTSM